MNYTEAIEAAKQGNKLSRKGWGHLFGWYHVTAYEDSLTMNDPCNGVPTIIRQWEYEPSKEDTRARDWEVIEVIRKWR